MQTIPHELQQAIHAAQGQPIRLLDPATNTEYILLQAVVYDRIQELLYDDTPLTQDEQRALALQAGLRAGWDDLEMDIYTYIRHTPYAIASMTPFCYYGHHRSPYKTRSTR